jgi:hypothetical protein
VKEVLPGVHHWRALHPNIHVPVSSYWFEEGGVVFDPLLADDEQLDWFAERPVQPAAVVLSNRHHYRHAGRFAERFGCPVLCNRSGLHEFTGGEPVEGFDPGEELPGGVLAYGIGAICPDETALAIPSRVAVVIADGVVRGRGDEGPLGFVPDSLMDDPPETRRGLLDAYGRMCAELEFEHLLLAHGGPVIGDGRAQLEELIDAGGRTAFEL